MKKVLYGILLVLFVFGLSSAVVAEEPQVSNEERCDTYAKEDGISAAELEEYLNECIESLKEEDINVQEKKD